MQFSSLLALALSAVAVVALPKNGVDDITTTLSNGVTTTIGDHGGNASPTPTPSGHDDRGGDSDEGNSSGGDDGNSTEDGDRSSEVEHGASISGAASQATATGGSNLFGTSSLAPANSGSSGAVASGPSLALGLVGALTAIMVGL